MKNNLEGTVAEIFFDQFQEKNKNKKKNEK